MSERPSRHEDRQPSAFAARHHRSGPIGLVWPKHRFATPALLATTMPVWRWACKDGRAPRRVTFAADWLSRRSSTSFHRKTPPCEPFRSCPPASLEHLGRRTILLLERQCQQLWAVVLGLPPLTQPLPQFGCTLLTSPGVVLFQATTLFAQGAASYFTTTGYSGRPARATGWRSR